MKSVPAKPRTQLDRNGWIDGAFEALAEEGLPGMRVEALAKRFGVTKGSFYHHLDAKDDLVIACCQRSFDIIGDTQRLADAQGGSQWQRLASAVATLLDYLHDTVMTDLSHISHLTYLDASENLVLDTYTLRNLEVTRNLRDGGKKDTLLDVLDFTETAMGSRLLKQWLEAPLLSIVAIDRRLDAVQELAEDFGLRGALADGLKDIRDFERLLTVAAADNLGTGEQVYTDRKSVV